MNLESYIPLLLFPFYYLFLGKQIGKQEKSIERRGGEEEALITLKKGKKWIERRGGGFINMRNKERGVLREAEEAL